MGDGGTQEERPAHEGFVPVDGGELYYREVGQGPTIVVLHGGPDFGHDYLLSDLDRLADSYRLIYYDQRGRGKSARGTRVEDVSIKSEIADLDEVRRYFGLEKMVLLGHSWGGYLAMEYAIRQPEHVSYMILMNSSAASHADYLIFSAEVSKRRAGSLEELQAILLSDGYKNGDPEAVKEYYRLHFGTTLKDPRLLKRIIASMGAGFSRESIITGWKIEERLVSETWQNRSFDLFPELRKLGVPTLVIHGEDDFIPVECAARIADAIPGARFVLLKGCGHFAYMEEPEAVHNEIDAFLA